VGLDLLSHVQLTAVEGGGESVRGEGVAPHLREFEQPEHELPALGQLHHLTDELVQPPLTGVFESLHSFEAALFETVIHDTDHTLG